MKITAIKTIVVNADMRNWVFVKVETDDPGLYGWGGLNPSPQLRYVASLLAALPSPLRGEGGGLRLWRVVSANKYCCYRIRCDNVGVQQCDCGGKKMPLLKSKSRVIFCIALCGGTGAGRDGPG